MDNDDRGAIILAATWTLTSLSGLFLAVRIFCKLRTKRRLWWDDHVLVVSWLMLLVSIVLVTMSVQKGLGKHVYSVPPENMSSIGFMGNLTGTFSILAAVWSKTSFALTLLRLMSGRMRIVLWTIIATINIFMGLNAVFLWTRCSPASKTWNPFVPGTGTCWEPHVYPAYGMFAAGYSGVMDFVLALLPWKVIWKLQMKRKEKVGVALAMSMGILKLIRCSAGGTAIVKTAVIPTLASSDFTYVSAPLIVWSAAESAVTIMAASIPVLRTLFRDLQTISKRHYGSSRRFTQTGSTNTDVVEITCAPGCVEMTPTSGGNSSRLRDSCGQILQKTEFAVTVEYRGGHGGDQ
ncbi:hypothetical protein C8A00DRAFT_47010 [Chaetomidium leptoderma]|uniref:Rhodopsin domain-containing protein n=1 Tax=Chaetomidium leptoderma TaxID=669021 RepID=A0AAN6ZT76_9PEZI|nr:hypothetical protein C8A00DRAFT_47010 [Chaetomidium leptoderma]